MIMPKDFYFYEYNDYFSAEEYNMCFFAKEFDH